MSNLLLRDIKKIYSHEASSQQPMSIWIQEGTIHQIAPYQQLTKEIKPSDIEVAQVIDCNNLIAIPGFVDSHTHLLFYGTREKELYLRAAGKSYLEILEQGGGIYNTVEAVRRASEEELLQHGLKFLNLALSFGITTVEIKSGYGLDFHAEEKMLRVICKLNEMHPVDIIPTFLVHTVPKEADRNKYLHQVCQQMIPAFRQYADWFDIYLEKGVFSVEEARRLMQCAKDAGYHLGMHTNQGHDIGGIPLAIEMGVRHVDHLELLSAVDANRIVDHPDLYTVFLPSAEAFVFSDHVGHIHDVMKAQNRIVISSDFNPGSSPVLSPLMIIGLALLRYRVSDPFLLIDSFTNNPSNMLFLNDRGTIKKGMTADIQLLEVDSIEQIPYFFSFNFQRYIIKKGEIVYKF